MVESWTLPVGLRVRVETGKLAKRERTLLIVVNVDLGRSSERPRLEVRGVDGAPSAGPAKVREISAQPPLKSVREAHQ